MGPLRCSFAALLLLLWLAVPGVRSTYWSLTSTYVGRTSVYTIGTRTSTRLMTPYMDVRPSATPTGRAFSTSLYVRSNEVTIVYVYYVETAFREEDILRDEDMTATTTSTTRLSSGAMRTSTYYMVPTVYRAPATCTASPWVLTTSTLIMIPDEFTAQYYPPSSIKTMSYPPSNVYLTHYLSTGAINLGAPPSLSAKLAVCSDPFPGYTSSGLPPPPPCNNMTCATFRAGVIAACSVVGGLVLLGVLESWVWFGRLMTGRYALRGGTVAWCLVTVLVCVCLTRGEPARTEEHAAILRRQWAEMKVGRRLRLWMAWGFRHSYPVDVLGLPNRALRAREMRKDGLRQGAAMAEVEEPFIAPPPPYVGAAGDGAAPPPPPGAPPVYRHQGGVYDAVGQQAAAGR